MSSQLPPTPDRGTAAGGQHAGNPSAKWGSLRAAFSPGSIVLIAAVVFGGVIMFRGGSCEDAEKAASAILTRGRTQREGERQEQQALTEGMRVRGDQIFARQPTTGPLTPTPTPGGGANAPSVDGGPTESRATPNQTDNALQLQRNARIARRDANWAFINQIDKIAAGHNRASETDPWQQARSLAAMAAAIRRLPMDNADEEAIAYADSLAAYGEVVAGCYNDFMKATASGDEQGIQVSLVRVLNLLGRREELTLRRNQAIQAIAARYSDVAGQPAGGGTYWRPVLPNKR